MKKNLYILMALMAVVFGFTACSDDDEATGTQNPETEVAGTYTGSWHQVLTNSSNEVQGEEFADGTVVLAPNRQWVVDVTLNVAVPVITTEMKDVANCSGNSESGYAMVNYNGATLGNYSCTVKDGAMTLIFVNTVKVGRKTYTATNTFTGTLN